MDAEANSSQFPAQLHEIEDGSAGAAADHHPGDGSPAVKGKVHQFYLVKLRRCEDPELESKIKEARGVFRTIYQARAPIVEEFEFRKMDHDKVRSKMDWRRRDWPWEHYMKRNLDHFRQSLHKLSSPNYVKKLKRRFIHPRPSQAKERQICKELTHLLQTREGIDSAQAEKKAKIISSYGTMDQIRQQIERIERDLKANAIRRKEEEDDYTCLLQRKAAIEKDLLVFKTKLVDLNKAKAKAHKLILDSSRMQATMRVDYDEHVATLNTAKELAAKKDLMGLEEFINRANERFMCKWNNEKGFKEVYKKRVASSSLDEDELRVSESPY